MVDIDPPTPPAARHEEHDILTFSKIKQINKALRGFKDISYSHAGHKCFTHEREAKH